jgi:antitoxin HigA-1
MNLPGLGVSRKSLSALLNGHFGISPEMAVRLAKAFGGSAESWLLQQAQYDLWHVIQKADNIRVTNFSKERDRVEGCEQPL